MNFSDKLLKENQRKANRTLVIVGQIVAILFVIIGVLDLVGVFVIHNTLFYIAIALSIGISLLPTLLSSLFHDDIKVTKYVILTSYTVMCGLMYCIVSYHAIIMLVFPLACSCLYGEKKYVIYTLFLLIPIVALSHIIAFYLHIVPDEPLVTMYGTVVYGILPRIIQIIAIGTICIGITERMNRVAMALADKNNDLYISQQTLIESLSNLIEYQSQETGQHVKRVSEYTKILCESLGYDDELTWKVSIASMMHDVGKIMIPNEIIDKTSKLTDEEFELIKKHTSYGKSMLEKSPGELMQLSSQIAYYHHEKWDGTGYMKIKGEDINIYARIVAIADVFDALVSKRPYKKAWSKEEAYQEIVNQSGKHFDPKLVDIFVSHFSEFEDILKKYPDNVEVDINDLIKKD